ncbi:uncharacterized protein BDV17DRAFT_295262 [Aspergillus undulatus]|uniref:uncharacterized protein n=1 Tax=Aspergillus undulatus TaxID=1810928 RepID=UPI003CCDAD2C
MGQHNSSQDMILHEYKQGAIQVLVGYTNPTGYFIRVHDKRLADTVSDREFDALCQTIDSSGAGCYFQAHTGTNGRGRHVSLKVMEELWRLYGVEQNHLDSLHAAQLSLRADVDAFVSAVDGGRVRSRTLPLLR